MAVGPFGELAVAEQPPLDTLALALAAEFGPTRADWARERLDALAAEVVALGPGGGPPGELAALVAVLAERHAFAGDRADYDAPANSMLDVVLERRRGLPILLSVVYVEVARRAGIALGGFGLPGHFVCGHVGADPPRLVDPFRGGAPLPAPAPGLRPWGPHATALRMLNNLTAAYARRGDVGRALHAAELRLVLPQGDPDRARHEHELRALRARLN